MAALGKPILSTLLGSLLLAAPLVAQRAPRSSEDRERLEQRIRAQMARMVRERLGLDDEQAARLGEVVQGFETRRRELFREEQAARRRVEALLLEDVKNPAEADELLARMVELRQQEAELFAEEQEALSTVLTPVQILELYAVREQIGRRIRALRGNRDDDAPRRRRRGGGPPLSGPTSVC